MDWILILGAKSDIAKALAHRFARAGHNLFLAARQPEKLTDFISDLEIRYQIKAQALEWDVLDQEKHSVFYHSLEPKPAGVIAVAGYLGRQTLAQEELQERNLIIQTNYSALVSMLEEVAKDFEERKTGWIIAFSSVAGDRGRQSNYFYGSAKAGLTCYLSGLRNRLYPSQIPVLTVKPGFVATAMTRHLKLPKLLTATPERVAKDVYKAHKKKKNTLYTPWFWRGIMFLVRAFPERFFKRLKL